ncbi:uncharacterized protein LOC110720734 [Chenopodium quinoa]|uniref:uncharacterized protein LOC110720734 n=1 Tax=Chenopodium quinoa TaxID=63459 RepID=UPI000B775F4C|nr:uncharacterized protein LOC110720734 [Chenopodium quinoa]
MWASDGALWPFKTLLKSSDIMPEDANTVIVFLTIARNKYGDNPLHNLAAYAPCEENTKNIAELLIDIYKNEISSFSKANLSQDLLQCPWLVKNNYGDTPLSLAIAHKNEDLAKYFLSVDENVVIECDRNVLFLAIEKECHTVAEVIFKLIDNKGWTQLLTNDQHLNVLHLAPLCPENFCIQLLEGHPELIKGVDKEGSTIIHSWIKSDKEWLFRFILKSKWKFLFVKLIDVLDYNDRKNVFHVAATTTHQATIEIALCTWQYATNVKNLSLYGVDHIDKLLDHYKPEHSILFLAIQNNCPKVAEYILSRLNKESRSKYLKDPSDGRNILHLAPNLKETLLSSDKIIYDIKDDEDISAIDLLAQECDNNQAWDRMCKRIGLDPRIKTTYFQSKTNLLDVRNSLFVVAALLATITFTAGFTLPGGFNQDTGDALLATKAAFLVFLISDTLALFFSMLVLICLIWSMVYDSSKSLFLIDRSMVLLRLALNSTLLAFMTGVYIVIAPKTLWAAILIIVIMSFLIGISINKTLLYNVLEYLDKLIPSPTKKPKDQIRVVELIFVLERNPAISSSFGLQGISSEQDHLLSHR